MPLEPKLKAQMAIQRFLSRGGGFVSGNADQVLETMDLKGVLPTHYGRTKMATLMRVISRASSPAVHGPGIQDHG